MASEWVKPDESAKALLLRVLTERPFLLLPPPLHRLPLRVGNVLEIVGPSPSAKTFLLTQAAINCILPKEWNGVQFGGLGRAVMFVDLDCRFDVFSLARLLKQRLSAPFGGGGDEEDSDGSYDEELFISCMRRFKYIRCYNSFEFLATLKTMHHQLLKEKKTHSGGFYLLMIDSIGAFYWMDRALSSSSGSNNRKTLSFQCIAETVVQEIQKLLFVHPMLVLASKSASFTDKQSTTETLKYPGKKSLEHASDFRNETQSLLHREFMPSIWQSFVTHRVLLRVSDNRNKDQNQPTFCTEWLLPSLNFSDKYEITDDGLINIL